MEQSLTLDFEKKFDKQGYILIFIDSKWIFEHRYIVEQFIGRKLTNKEKVHHDDFCKSNNDISNLTLFPTGSRHNHWHRQILQFGFTRVRQREINQLKELMIIERIKNNRLEVYNE